MKKVTKICDSTHERKRSDVIKVAAYCRVSTDSDAQLESLETQKKHYEKYINGREDWEFAGIYFDEGITGTKKEKRPELLRMIKDCEAGKIDFIITKSISRFSRSTTDCLEMVRKLLDLNIPIYFEKEDLNTGSMESEFVLSVLSSMAEGESSSISENSKWSVQKRFQNGTFKLCCPPYGYAWNGKQLVVIPEQAEIVRWIFAQVLSGNGTQSIAYELNNRGVPTKRGGCWTATTLQGMITNEKYTGDAIFQKTYTDTEFNRHINNGQKDKYAVTEHHEAIISHETFNAANAMIAQRRHEKGIVKGSEKYQHRYSFSSKIICGECGDTFKRRIHSSTTHKYVAWCCNTHIYDKNICSMKYVRDDEIKAAFVRMINKLVFGHSLVLKPYIGSLKKCSKDYALNKIQKLQSDLIDNAQKRETLSKLMAQGYIDRIIYTEESNRLLTQSDSYKAEIDTLTKNISGEAAHITAALDLLNFTEKGVMLDGFNDELFTNTVDRIIVVSRNEIVFELNCGLKLKERL